jgi:hypothetical protein
MSVKGLKDPEAAIEQARISLDTEAAIERARIYIAAHPRGPSAVRRPKLSLRSGIWIAILGPNIQEGIVGIGTTVEAALRAFDAQYLAALRPQNEKYAPAA